MNLLTTILPGLRDFRAPFISGVLYLICGLVALDQWSDPASLTSLPAVQAVRALDPKFVGAISVSAVSLSAYIAGSVMTYLFSSAVRRARFESFSRYWSQKGVRDWVHSELLRVDTSPNQPLSSRLAQVPGLEFQISGRISDDAKLEPEQIGEHIVRKERQILATRLQIEHTVVYEEFDRLTSEAELRIALVPPIILLGALNASSLGWIFTPMVLLVAATLFYQGQALASRADERIWQALQTGSITSPTLDYVKQHLGAARSGA